MEHIAAIDRMRRAHLDWQLALLKAGPKNLATRVYKKKLDLALDACAPRAPKMEGRA